MSIFPHMNMLVEKTPSICVKKTLLQKTLHRRTFHLFKNNKHLCYMIEPCVLSHFFHKQPL